MFDSETLCRNLAAATAAGFTTFVIAGWALLDGTRPQMVSGVVCCWLALLVQRVADRRAAR